ncbi:MAG: type III restriction endonuclease subunit R, partial [Kingella oralis]
MAKTTFHDHLILNRYLLRLFGVKTLPELRQKLNLDSEALIGLAEDGQSKFLHQLLSPLIRSEIGEDDLRRYDLNIVRHWQQITERRNRDSGHVLEMKYFQYLSLLFAEIYLDRYFNHKAALQTALQNEFAAYEKEFDKASAVSAPHALDDLRKLAFWNATGSGKTLLMHV